MAIRVFYVIYFENKDIQRTLDAVRFIFNPKVKNPAHVTIRGPYRQRYKINNLRKQISGSFISVLGIDSFFNETQNTVVIKIDSPNLLSVWKKDDYGYNPHITIYDGNSRSFASDLVDLLSKINFTFSFVAEDLSPLISHKGQNSFNLKISFDEEFISKLLERKITVGEIEKFSFEERLPIIEKLMRILPKFGTQNDSIRYTLQLSQSDSDYTNLS
jgi:hypothetical protein